MIKISIWSLSKPQFFFMNFFFLWSWDGWQITQSFSWMTLWSLFPPLSGIATCSVWCQWCLLFLAQHVVWCREFEWEEVLLVHTRTLTHARTVLGRLRKCELPQCQVSGAPSNPLWIHSASCLSWQSALFWLLVRACVRICACKCKHCEILFLWNVRCADLMQNCVSHKASNCSPSLRRKNIRKWLYFLWKL